MTPPAVTPSAAPLTAVAAAALPSSEKFLHATIAVTMRELAHRCVRVRRQCARWEQCHTIIVVECVHGQHHNIIIDSVRTATDNIIL